MKNVTNAKTESSFARYGRNRPGPVRGVPGRTTRVPAGNVASRRARAAATSSTMQSMRSSTPRRSNISWAVPTSTKIARESSSTTSAASTPATRSANGRPSTRTLKRPPRATCSRSASAAERIAPRPAMAAATSTGAPTGASVVGKRSRNPATPGSGRSRSTPCTRTISGPAGSPATALPSTAGHTCATSAS
jgi:hypothetical protein